jgi:glycine dehydrogenase subunit 1
VRYLPLTPADRAEMLAVVGAENVDALFVDVPEGALLKAPVDLPAHAGEIEVERALASLAAKNVPAGAAASFLGAGAYRHFIPAAVDHLIQRGEFLTAYTPYQPEISQGTLQYMFEFQTQVAMITGMEIANASLYDGASGAAEAALMAKRTTRRAGVVIAGGVHPHWRDTVVTELKFTDAAITCAPVDPEGHEDVIPLIGKDTACVIVQNPDVFGHIRDLTPLADACHAQGALLVVCVAEVASLGLITSPGAMGADIVVGEGQGLGPGLNFGGPYLGLFATRERFVRQMPGRIAGQTVDADGKRGWVLTLSTREQHIRREKATSNICTNSGLCALAFSIHMALLGEKGFKRLARLNHAAACRMADRLVPIKGIEVLNNAFFNEVTVRLPMPAAPLVDALARGDVAGGPVFAGVPASRLYPGASEMDNLLIVCATETTVTADIERLGAAIEGALK